MKRCHTTWVTSWTLLRETTALSLPAPALWTRPFQVRGRSVNTGSSARRAAGNNRFSSTQDSDRFLASVSIDGKEAYKGLLVTRKICHTKISCYRHFSETRVCARYWLSKRTVHANVAEVWSSKPEERSKKTTFFTSSYYICKNVLESREHLRTSSETSNVFTWLSRSTGLGPK
jgi:hypothetical protein